jgi:endonuclease G, mitochondrial
MSYNINFLEDDQSNIYPVPLPKLHPSLLEDSYNNGEVIEHTRFSLVFNAKRKLAFYAAYNIDGRNPRSLPQSDAFRYDPKLPSEIQLHSNQGYVNNPWDRGHLARRAELTWGTIHDIEEAKTAERESFYYSNIAPQHENLHDTPWGDIEDWVLKFTVAKINKTSVFAGPIFTKFDEIWQPQEGPSILIPSGYWKIITKPHKRKLWAAGFIVWQKDFDNSTERILIPITEQVRITTIEFLTGLDFGELRNKDIIQFGTLTEDAFRLKLQE